MYDTILKSLVIVTFSIVITPFVNGATITVNSVADPGDGLCDSTECTLREAIGGASAGDTINFRLATNSTITLTNAELVIDKNLMIVGPGSDVLTVSGSHSRILRITVDAIAYVSGLTISNGWAYIGGGIHNSGTLIVSESTITNNRVIRDQNKHILIFGGGIYNAGTMVVSSSKIQGNRAGNDREGSPENGDGGGIFNVGTLTVIDSAVFENYATFGFGGGVYNEGTLEVHNTTFFKNGAWNGGGIASSSSLTVYNSAFIENGGGGCTVEGGSNFECGGVGGGIAAYGISTISHSTFFQNAATNFGGGISNRGTLKVINSTLSRNATLGGNCSGSGTYCPPPEGGGIWNDGVLTVSNSTFVGNNPTNEGSYNGYGAGAIYSTSGMGVSSAVKNSIFAGNSQSGNCSGLITSEGINYSTDSTCGFSQVTLEQLNLGTLAENGGPTQTYDLLPGSVAIDAAGDCNDLDGNAVATDQRGVSRPQGATCDVGSFEFEFGDATPTPTPSPTLTPTPTPPPVPPLRTTFVIGDISAVVGSKVTFHGAQWSKVNQFTGGPAPASFKGYAKTIAESPDCGEQWTSDIGGGSSPAFLPNYIAVLVSSSVTQSGSLISGDVVGIAVIHVDSGYRTMEGTGTVVSISCLPSLGAAHYQFDGASKELLRLLSIPHLDVFGHLN